MKSMMKVPAGTVPRGRVIRLYPTIEQRQHLRLVQDEARAAWNLLVSAYERMVWERFARAERDGIIGPRPEKPAPSAGRDAWREFYRVKTERAKLARAHSPDLMMPIPRGDATSYQMLWAAWPKKRRMTANMYQALIQDFGRAMIPKRGANRWRPPRRRTDNDDMPVRTGTGICVRAPKTPTKRRNIDVVLPQLGAIAGYAHRDLDLMVKGSLVQGVALTEHTDGWYAAVRIYTPTPELAERTITEPIGVDVGLDYLAALSDGRKWENPRNGIVDAAVTTDGPKVIKRLPRDRVLSGRIDNRWRETDERAMTRRARHVGCLIDSIVKALEPYRVVVIEGGDTSMGSDHWIAPSLEQASGLGRTRRKDPYVSAMGRLQTALKNRLGDRVAEVDRAYTSQECSKCGHRDKAAWSRRVDDHGHARLCRCPSCGYENDRDVNAARNLVRRYEDEVSGMSREAEPTTGLTPHTSHLKARES